MKIYLPRKILFCFLASILIQTQCYAHEPQNLAQVKQQLIHYYETNEYQRDLTQVIREAKHELVRRVEENRKAAKPDKLAIVLDIDETSLSNFKHLRDLDFGCFDSVKKIISEGNSAAIAPTLNLYRYAIKHNVAVFFVTGRDEKSRDYTEKNLQDMGFYSWNELFMKPNNYSKSSVSPYKTRIRKQITHDGYTIVLNIGDQVSDLRGGYAEHAYKLPNPYYYIN